jgi:hypothetical protein
MMHWRRSLFITAILLCAGFLQSIFYGLVLGLLYQTPWAQSLNLSAAAFAQWMSWFSFGISGVVHFVVLWWAFRHFAGQDEEKAKRSQPLDADTVLASLAEDELEILRERLIPPGKRSAQ